MSAGTIYRVELKLDGPCVRKYDMHAPSAAVACEAASEKVAGGLGAHIDTSGDEPDDEFVGPGRVYLVAVTVDGDRVRLYRVRALSAGMACEGAIARVVRVLEAKVVADRDEVPEDALVAGT